MHLARFSLFSWSKIFSHKWGNLKIRTSIFEFPNKTKSLFTIQHNLKISKHDRSVLVTEILQQIKKVLRFRYILNKRTKHQIITDYEKQQHPKNFKIVILHLPTKSIVHIHLALELTNYCSLEQNKDRQDQRGRGKGKTKLWPILR